MAALVRFHLPETLPLPQPITALTRSKSPTRFPRRGKISTLVDFWSGARFSSLPLEYFQGVKGPLSWQARLCGSANESIES
jgi:hypothetical protein